MFTSAKDEDRMIMARMSFNMIVESDDTLSVRGTVSMNHMKVKTKVDRGTFFRFLIVRWMMSASGRGRQKRFAESLLSTRVSST